MDLYLKYSTDLISDYFQHKSLNKYIIVTHPPDDVRDQKYIS